MGAVDVRRAYSRATDRSEGCRHVQDRMFRDRAEVNELWNRGAKLFLCGSRAVGEGVMTTAFKMREERMKELGMPATREDISKWFESVRNERYATDVFD